MEHKSCIPQVNEYSFSETFDFTRRIQVPRSAPYVHHSFARARRPTWLIQDIVGHVSSRMLLHYAHVSSGAARKAVESLDSEAILTPTLTNEQKTEKLYLA
jgi:hypothetical protein